MKKTVSIFFLLTLSFVLHAQVKSFSIEAAKNQIVIGEPFELVVKAVYPLKGNFGYWEIDDLPHFEILGTGKLDSLEQGYDLHVQQKLTVTSWDSGKWEIPAITFNGKQSKPLIINVGYSPFDPKQDYHDIKEILEVDKPAKTRWYWYLLGVLLFIVLAILLFPGGKKTPVQEVKREVAHPTNFRTTMQSLENLSAESSRITTKNFYTQLKDILRSYLQLKMNSDPFTTTSAVLGEKIKGFEVNVNDREKMSTVLTRADLAKFAKHEAGEEEKQDSLSAVKNLIVAIENKN